MARNYQLQTVLFDKKLWTIHTAIEWLEKHKLKHGKVDVKKNRLRFRQVAPATVRRKGFTKFITHGLDDGKQGIEFILAYLPED